MDTENIILRGEHLTKIYQTGKAEPFAALDDVSIGIKRAELTILKGRSGSGKTTLINMLSALDKPTSGSVVMEDTELTELSAEKMEEFRRVHMGFVFELPRIIAVASLCPAIIICAYHDPVSDWEVHALVRIKIFGSLAKSGK